MTSKQPLPGFIKGIISGIVSLKKWSLTSGFEVLMNYCGIISSESSLVLQKPVLHKYSAESKLILLNWLIFSCQHTLKEKKRLSFEETPFMTFSGGVRW